MKKIGIVVAMAEELKPYLSLIGRVKDECVKGNTPIYTISAGDKYLTVINSGVGEIAAAAATQKLISEYGVECIFNYGYAGSLSTELKFGDIVAVNGVLHYEYDISPVSPDMRPYMYREIGTEIITCDVQPLLDAKPDLKCAVCASGNLLINKEKMRNRLKALGCALCEMEAAGVALTAFRNDIPCYLLKIISDNADENAINDFDTSLSKKNEGFEKILKRVIETL